MITETLQLSRKQILLSSVLATIVLGTTPIQMQAEIIPMNVVQQNQAVKGQVLDNNGDPIIGATVKVEGTKNATVTDLDGNFTLNNVTGKKLQVSYIGYQNQVVDINNRSNIKITMYEDNKTLGEVVVVGYGTQKQSTYRWYPRKAEHEEPGSSPTPCSGGPECGVMYRTYPPCRRKENR